VEIRELNQYNVFAWEDIKMKKRIVWLIAVLLAPVMVAYASPAHANAGVSIQLPGFGLSVGPGGVGLNIGLPWVVASAPVPAPVPAPAYAYPGNSYEEVVTEQAPEFVQPPELGFYVAVGVPYDLFFYNNSYWICRGNIWYNSAYYNGPWNQIYYTNIPYVFNRLPFERIHHYRDSYYGRYQRDGAWQGYSHFRPRQHNDYRVGSGRNRYDFARPQNQGQTNRYSTDSRFPNSTRQGSGNGYTSGRTINRTRDDGNSHAYTRPSSNGHANSGRQAYSRPNSTAQRNGIWSAPINSSSIAPSSGNRTVYTRPDNNGNNSYGGNNSGNRYSYARQNNIGQGYNGRYAYSRPNNSRQTSVSNPVYTRTNSFGNGVKRNGFSNASNKRDSVHRDWQGGSR
jgi:hypothetical protein